MLQVPGKQPVRNGRYPTLVVVGNTLTARAREPRSVSALRLGSCPAARADFGDIGPQPVHQDEESALHTDSGVGVTGTTGTTASIGARFICRILKIMTPRNSSPRLNRMAGGTLSAMPSCASSA